jgi:polyhydroxybutyrate depolymerase
MNSIVKLKISFCAIIIVIMASCSIVKNAGYAKNLVENKMVWDGFDRTYYTYIPTNIKEVNSTPLLFHLHGGGGTGQGTPGLTFGRFNELADEHGFIVVYPNAIEKNWNDGRPLEEVRAWEQDIDDVGFILNIIERIQNEYSIDKNRIFTTGMSNGGFMSSRLICDRPEVFKGAAVLTASISEEYFTKCTPQQPVSVLLMNGTADPLVPYDGGEVKVFKKKRGTIVSTDDYINFWAKQNGCDPKKNEVDLPDLTDDGTSVSHVKFSGCSDGAKVELYIINGGGHTWPGGLQYLGEKVIGKTSRDVNACDVIWDFFKEL